MSSRHSHQVQSSSGMLRMSASIMLCTSHTRKCIHIGVYLWVHRWLIGAVPVGNIWLGWGVAGSIPRSAFVFCGWENVCKAYVWSIQAYLRLTERSPITDHAHACSKRSKIDTIILQNTVEILPLTQCSNATIIDSKLRPRLHADLLL